MYKTEVMFIINSKADFDRVLNMLKLFEEPLDHRHLKVPHYDPKLNVLIWRMCGWSLFPNCNSRTPVNIGKLYDLLDGELKPNITKETSIIVEIKTENEYRRFVKVFKPLNDNRQSKYLKEVRYYHSVNGSAIAYWRDRPSEYSLKTMELEIISFEEFKKGTKWIEYN